MNQKKVGFRIRLLREEGLDLSRKQFGDALGVHEGSVARWEVGGSLIEERYVFHMEERWGVTHDWLYFGEGPPPPSLSQHPVGADAQRYKRAVFRVIEALDDEGLLRDSGVTSPGEAATEDEDEAFGEDADRDDAASGA